MTVKLKGSAKTKHAGKSKRALPFNSQSIEAAGPIDGKQTEYRIEGERGLILVVTPENTGSYFFRYTVGQGKTRKFRSEKLGRRDEITLHNARERAAELRLAVGRGGDPVAEGDAKRNATTFDALFAERMSKDNTKADRTLEDYKRALETDHVLSTPKKPGSLGPHPASDITADQIAKVLEDIEARSKHAAHKVRSAIGSTFRWGMKRRKVRQNPTLGLGFTVQSKPRNRVLSDNELAEAWQEIDSGPNLTEPMRIILKLAVLTCQRESEVAGALVAELKLDIANPKWRILSERMKRRNREQIVPLSTQAVALFKRAIKLNNGSPYAFPADKSRTRIGRTPRKPHIHGESVSRAMARLRERAGIDDARVHDLRKTVTTWLREEKRVSSDVCDLILHHARKGVTASHYDFSTLEGPVRDALQTWADYVERVSRAVGAGEAAKKVVQLRA